MSAITRPIVLVRPVIMARASSLRWYPSSTAAASTAPRADSLTAPYPPRARAAGAVETPARRATSGMVGEPPLAGPLGTHISISCDPTVDAPGGGVTTFSTLAAENVINTFRGRRLRA